jgi:adhesin/invasin
MLKVEEAYGNVVTSYTGTVHFSSSDSTASLPSNYKFTGTDVGVHTFTNKVMLKKKGTPTLTVTDTEDPALTATLMLTVV